MRFYFIYNQLNLIQLISFLRYAVVAESIMSLLAGHAADGVYEDSDMRAEADAFLSAMPPGIQERQEEAIRLALAGDCSALENVRNARRIASPLPQGIVRTEVGPDMTLFRSERHTDRNIPLLIYFHGGGWTIGSINSCSRYCAAMAKNGVNVLAVDYSLAPEHPYPAGLTDCIAAAEFALNHKSEWNISDISLGGDSSGGNLAIATAMSFPRNSFSSMVLFYPVTRAYADASGSWQLYNSGYGLDGSLMEAFNDSYTYDIHNPLVSPQEADPATLSKLPPTLMIAAERDILRCQGAEFADKLGKSGVQVKYILLPGTVHLFITVDGQPTAFQSAVRLSSEFLKANSY